MSIPVSSTNITAINIYLHLKNLYPTKKFNLPESLYKTLTHIYLQKGDITKLPSTVIVNAANTQLLPGGGVCGSIFRNSKSKKLVIDCLRLAPCSIGQFKKTNAYELPAKYIFHAVGPNDQDARLLKKTYKNCLDGLIEERLNSIAFPCISTGIYGFPSEKAASLVTQLIVQWFFDRIEKELWIPERVYLVCYLNLDYELYLNKFKILLNKYENEEESQKEEIKS